MADFVQVNQYFEETTTIGLQAVKVEDTETVSKIAHGPIAAGNSASLELISDDVDYLTSGAAKVILIITGDSTTLTDFEVIEDTVVNNGGGTQKEDFSSVSMSGTQFVTTKILSFAASRYITIKANTGDIGKVRGWVIE